MNNANDTDKQRLKQIIENGDRNAIDTVIEILNKTDSINYTQRVALKYANLAKQALSPFPDSKYKTMLNDLAELSIKRVQ